MKVLVAAGADVVAKNKYGETPRDIATLPDTIRLLDQVTGHRKGEPLTDCAKTLTQADHRLRPACASHADRSRPHVIFGKADSRRVWIDEVELTPEESWTYRIY